MGTEANDPMFITNDTAANDPICQAAMAAYARAQQIEEERRQAVRDAVAAGDLEAIAKWGRTSNWYISDRD